MEAELLSVQRIWDRAPHNAFTDLIRWDGRFWCAFREGRGHVSTDGRIRVLVSKDLEKWGSAGLLEMAGFDLRDASLSVTPDNRLMVLGGAAPRPRDGVGAPTGSFVSFSADRKTFTKPEIVVQPGRWLWRVTWHKAAAYGVSYPANEGKAVRLLTSKDGRTWRTLVEDLFDKGQPNEATPRFDDDGTCLLMMRRERATGILGIARPPYTRWTWHEQPDHPVFGGPNLIRTPVGLLAAGRQYRPDVRTILTAFDPATWKMRTILVLPSGGDTSYPGLVWHDGVLYVSYYSSHERKTSIYLAKVRLKPAPGTQPGK